MYYSLQILRGLAAWAVVAHHIVMAYFLHEPPNLLWHYLYKYGDLGVDIFFVLSGFIMAMTSVNYIRKGHLFLVNRLFRIVPNYWFYTAILAITVAIGLYDSGWTEHSLRLSFLFIPHEHPVFHANYPLLTVGWTLIYELFFYVVLSIALWLRIPKAPIVCATLLYTVAILYRDTPFLGQSSLYLIEFSMGIAIYYLSLQFKKRQMKAFALTITTSFFAFIYFVYLTPLSQSMMSAEMGLAMMIVCMGVIFESKIPTKNPVTSFLKKLGDYSYSTYLCHLIVIGVILSLKQHTAFNNDTIAVGGIIIVTYGVSLWSYAYIEKNTTLKRVQKIMGGR